MTLYFLLRDLEQDCFLLSGDIWGLKGEDTVMLSHSHLGHLFWRDWFGTALPISQQWIAHLCNIQHVQYALWRLPYHHRKGAMIQSSLERMWETILKRECGGLTLAGHQALTKAALSLPSSAGQGRENITKGSWIEIRTGRSLTNYCHGQNRLDLGKKINLIYYQSNQSRIMRNKTKA